MIRGQDSAGAQGAPLGGSGGMHPQDFFCIIGTLRLFLVPSER